MPPRLTFTSPWNTPARRQPVWPGAREFESFSTVAYGSATVPGYASDPSGEAILSHAAALALEAAGPMPNAKKSAARAATSFGCNAQDSLLALGRRACILRTFTTACGPPFIGFLAEATSLPLALSTLCLGLAFVTVAGRRIGTEAVGPSVPAMEGAR